jgi:hypothetical protein
MEDAGPEALGDETMSAADAAPLGQPEVAPIADEEPVQEDAPESALEPVEGENQ